MQFIAESSSSGTACGQPSTIASSNEPEKENCLGRLTDDGLSYKEKFVLKLRCYEVGINKTATVETIADLLQEVGGNHAQSVGFSTDGFATTSTMRISHGLLSDVIEIETWIQGEGRIGTRRHRILKDYTSEEVIGRATSKSVMMNVDTRRSPKVADDVRKEYLGFFPRTLRLAFSEENNSSMKKIAKLKDPADYSRIGLMPRSSDLDIHNVNYIGWVMELI